MRFKFALLTILLVFSQSVSSQSNFSPVACQLKQIEKEKDLLRKQKIKKIIIEKFGYSFGEQKKVGIKDSLFEYDKNQNLIRRESDFEKNGTPKKVELFKYDIKNKLIEYSLVDLRVIARLYEKSKGEIGAYLENIQISEKTIYKYDIKNRLVDETKYCSSNEICKKIVYNYSDNDSLVLVKEYDENGQIEKTYTIDQVAERKKKEDSFLKIDRYSKNRTGTIFQYDNNGNLLKVNGGANISYIYRQNFRDTFTSDDIKNHKYTYDDRGDLSAEELTSFRHTIGKKYSYDVNGNVISILQLQDKEPQYLYNFTYINHDKKTTNEKLYIGKIIDTDSIIAKNLANEERERKEVEQKQILIAKEKSKLLAGSNKVIFSKENLNKYTISCKASKIIEEVDEIWGKLTKENIITNLYKSVSQASGTSYSVCAGIFENKEDAIPIKRLLNVEYLLDRAEIIKIEPFDDGYYFKRSLVK